MPTGPVRTLRTPEVAGGLRRDDSAATRQVVDEQREELRQSGVPGPVAMVYRRSTEATVLFLGASGRLSGPERRLREMLADVADSAGGGPAPTRHPAGRMRGVVLCVNPLNTGDAVLAACGWADDDTLGVITTDNGDATQTATLLLAMRADMET